ncbi:DNA helicase [Bacteroidia bacterium]|nr:DNA helicase [Bacteroidia bacterium]
MEKAECRIKVLRTIYEEFSGGQLVAKTTENERVVLELSAAQMKEMTELKAVLQSGIIMNWLNAKQISENTFEAEFIVLEPNYLMDISALAECFKPYGHHFLNYTLSRLQAKETTSPILLGNAANFFVDEFVYEDEQNPVDFMVSLKKLFRLYPFELTACKDLKNPKTENDFFVQCQKHFQHIRQVVQKLFPKIHIRKENIVLEPSFISNALGLQGRLDIMLSDYSQFIELKSGKAVEDFRNGGAFLRSAENHYTQMILYLAVLEFNLNLPADAIQSYLLYSKYPVLSRERHHRPQLQKALSLRNQIVAWEYALQRANRTETTEALLNGIRASELNTEKMTGKLFDCYLAPNINCFPQAFEKLKDAEKAYFLRLYTFVVKELWLSKAGEREYEGVKKASVLWNVSFADKILAGELLYDLQVTDNQADSETHTITLSIPEYKDFYLPNFRNGDAVVLYERNSAADTVNNRQVFKGSIEQLDTRELTIRLRYRQKNRSVWNVRSTYAVEHDYMDTTYASMFKGFTAFIEANQDRKDLLLCKRPPAEGEIFLLIGPPGTGKTSIALKKMVEDELKKNKTTILLMSYTNRAVDEICKALVDIHPELPFIRIGSELNCAPEFRPQLLENRLENCTKRSEVAELMSRCRIFAGTVASLANKPELFQLKRFDLAIIDEATQLLEPHLLGILCAKTNDGANSVQRFVLIGDHKQLPAVVLQSKEESRVQEVVLNEMGLTNLSDSLFERLYRKYTQEGWNTFWHFLSAQGRMHPDIAYFPSEQFYEGKLGCAGLPHQIETGTYRRLNFYPVQPEKCENSEKTNLNEARQVVAICRKIFGECLENQKPFNPQHIGIITPFRNQIALIRKQLQETGISEFAEITVDTVERFQGSQRDIIIYSFCIKTESQLTALPNWLEENGKSIDRKLNVALTRAKKQLHIVGNELLLSKNPLYKRLIDHFNYTKTV